MIKKLLFAGLTLFNLFVGAQGFVATYGFGNVTTSSGTVDPTPLPSAAGVTFSPFLAVGNFTNPNASSRFSYIGWPTGSANGVDTYSTFTGALSPTVYYEVSIAPQPGYNLTLNAITFSTRRSSTGVRNYSVRSSADAYATNLPASVGSNTKLAVLSSDVFFWSFDATSTTADQKGNTITLGGQDFTSFTNTATFRFYAWNAEGSGGTFSIDSVVFSGSASSTPTLPTAVQSAGQNVQDHVEVFPSPARDGVIWVQPGFRFSKIELVNFLGEVVATTADTWDEEKAGFATSGLPPGIYFVRVYAGTAVSRKRFVIE